MQKESEIEKEKGEKSNGEDDTWSKDQREKSYYYDDAHGYEIFQPEDDETENEDIE